MLTKIANRLKNKIEIIFFNYNLKFLLFFVFFCFIIFFSFCLFHYQAMRAETTPASVCFTSITISYTFERQFCVGGGGGAGGGG